MLDRLESAIELAVMLHKFQKDYAGEPYILHPLRVMLAIRDRAGTEDEQIAAILHDVVEDTAFTLGDILNRFGEEVARLVDALTRRPSLGGIHGYRILEEETYPNFIERVIEAGPSATKIKGADITDNLWRLDTIRALDSAKALRLEKKYKQALWQIWVAEGSKNELGY